MFVLMKQADGGADLPGSAVAALEAVVLEEGGLDRVKRVSLCEAFDGGYLGCVGGDGEGEAGVDAAAIDENGAGSALSVIAALLAAREGRGFRAGRRGGWCGCRGLRHALCR